MDRRGLISALVSEGIKRYFKEHPVRDNSEEIKQLGDKLDELNQRIKTLAERNPGETIIELNTQKE